MNGWCAWKTGWGLMATIDLSRLSAAGRHAAAVAVGVSVATRDRWSEESHVQTRTLSLPKHREHAIVKLWPCEEGSAGISDLLGKRPSFFFSDDVRELQEHMGGRGAQEVGGAGQRRYESGHMCDPTPLAEGFATP